MLRRFPMNPPGSTPKCLSIWRWPRPRSGLLVAISLLSLAGPGVRAADWDLHVGLGVEGFRPLGDLVRQVYAVGVGAHGELGLSAGYKWKRMDTAQFRLRLSFGPTVTQGDPITGPLAQDASSELRTLVTTATTEFTYRARSLGRPYAGFGVNLHHVNEDLQFTSVFGAIQESRSWDAWGWHAVLGLERTGLHRWFAELRYLWATVRGANGLQGRSGARNIGGLELRLGYRRTLL